MGKAKKEAYIPKVNSDGIDVYCQFNPDNDRSTDTVDADDDCIERDVVERYSGNIDIRS